MTSTRARSITAAVSILTALAIVACGTDAGSSHSLEGRTFLSQSVTVDGQTKTLVSGTGIRVTFHDDERITAIAGCNILSGSVTVSDERLVVNDLGSTEMGCDGARHAQDEWLASVLSAWPRYLLEGDRLVLQTDGTVIEFLDREVADPDRSLQSTVWAVDGIINGSTMSSLIAGTSATVVFDASEVRISIDACNEGAAKLNIHPSSIEVGPFVMTDIACAEAPARLEAALVDVLEGKITYSIEAGSLRLMHPSGKGLTLRAD